MKKELLYKLRYIFFSIIISIILGALLLMLVYSLPIKNIIGNIANSSNIYATNEMYPQWAPDNLGSTIDNYTDSLMLNLALFPGTGSSIKDSMNSPYLHFLNSQTPIEDLFLSFSEANYEYAYLQTYPRYWHGYLTVLKPLLSVTSFSNIRMMNAYLQLILLCVVCIKLFQLGKAKALLPFGDAILVINPISTALCMQFSSIYYITLLGILSLLHMKDTKNYWKIFLWIGICTAYFDLLTYPLVGLGITLLIFLTVKNTSSEKQLPKVLTASGVWLLGYAGMWIGKWILAYIITGNNIILDGFSNVLHRMNDDTLLESGISNASKVQGILLNLEALLTFPIIVLICIGTLWFIKRLLGKKYVISINPSSALNIGIVALFPFVWYLIVNNHSIIHRWMTYRSLSITVFAVTYILISTIKPKSSE